MVVGREALLEAGLAAVGVPATDASISAVLQHLDLVRDWNERVNLTAITDEAGMIIKHAVDSAMALQVANLGGGKRVIDVGTGAGFPGVTLKLLSPGVELVLLESLQKRCRFLEAVRDEVIAPLCGGDSGTEVVWGRAEEVGQKPAYRESFDLAVARAVAELRVLVEYCLPFVRVGGRFVALKGPTGEAELEAAGRAIEVLGGAVADVRRVTLPEGAGDRTVIVVEKIGFTPKAYPRKAGTPERKPL